MPERKAVIALLCAVLGLISLAHILPLKRPASPVNYRPDPSNANIGGGDGGVERFRATNVQAIRALSSLANTGVSTPLGSTAVADANATQVTSWASTGVVGGNGTLGANGNFEKRGVLANVAPAIVNGVPVTNVSAQGIIPVHVIAAANTTSFGSIFVPVAATAAATTATATTDAVATAAATATATAAVATAAATTDAATAPVATAAATPEAATAAPSIDAVATAAATVAASDTVTDATVAVGSAASATVENAAPPLAMAGGTVTAASVAAEARGPTGITVPAGQAIVLLTMGGDVATYTATVNAAITSSIATATGVSAADVSVVSVAAGSVIVSATMPSAAGSSLVSQVSNKTLATLGRQPITAATCSSGCSAATPAQTNTVQPVGMPIGVVVAQNPLPLNVASPLPLGSSATAGNINGSSVSAVFRVDRKSLPLLHKGENCWDHCEGQGGMCAWCGSGLCCREGYRPDLRKGLCLKLQGCQHYHCCTKELDRTEYEPDENKLKTAAGHARVIPAMVIVCICMAVALVVCWWIQISKHKAMEDRQLLVEAYIDEVDRKLQQSAEMAKSRSTAEPAPQSTDVDQSDSKVVSYIGVAGTRNPGIKPSSNETQQNVPCDRDAQQIHRHEFEEYELIAQQGHTWPFSVNHRLNADASNDQTRWAFVHK